jgi:hypothetical protein
VRPFVTAGASLQLGWFQRPAFDYTRVLAKLDLGVPGAPQHAGRPWCTRLCVCVHVSMGVCACVRAQAANFHCSLYPLGSSWLFVALLCGVFHGQGLPVLP